MLVAFKPLPLLEAYHLPAADCSRKFHSSAMRKNTFMFHLSYGRLGYPNENYINSLMRLSHLNYIQCLAIVITLGHRAAIPPTAGHRYDIGDTKR